MAQCRRCCSDVVDDLLGFFLAVFRCLRVQMGVTAAEKLVHLFISLFTRYSLHVSTITNWLIQN